MKKILFLLVLLSFPYSAVAGLDMYLSDKNLPYGKDVWTSANFPVAGSSKMQIDSYFYREEFPQGYKKSARKIKDLIDELFSPLTPAERQARYNSFMAFEKQNLADYIEVALSPYIDGDIVAKKTDGFILTPFESRFQSCGIDLAERKNIVRNLITEIHNKRYNSVESLSYTDVRFGDCIIPFPDVRRGSTLISDSFPSNKLIVKSLEGNPLRFGTLENSVNLFSLANLNLGGSYAGVQENNLLTLKSTRVEQDRTFPKEIGASKVLFVHQNHHINIFKDTLITGNNTAGYRVDGTRYNASHPLFFKSVDTEEDRTFLGWEELQEGVYTKTLIQEDSFDTIVGGIFTPKQTVGATTYYAILYNYDTTPPSCPTTLFSHESAGKENFILPDYPWFQTTKYGYFACSDEESGCSCDTSQSGCFTKKDTILSIPKKVPYAGVFNYTFQNAAGLSKICTSPVEEKLFYDSISPDMRIILPGVPEATLEREYVTNEGILYDGVQVTDKKMYHIKNTLRFPADQGLAIQLQLYDTYDSSKKQQGVSGLNSYRLSISALENKTWVKKIQQDQTFENYNPLGTIRTQDTRTLNFNTLKKIQDIVTKVGSYQVYLDIEDAAGNQSRVIFYFDIRAGSISPSRSTLETAAKNTLFADNISSYAYTLTLRDNYLNPVSGKIISSIVQSCAGVLNCSQLQLDMTTPSPSGGQALEVYNMDTISDAQGKVDFSLRSVVPGVFTESFLVNTADPVASVRLSGETNIFLSPLRGLLEAKVSSEWVADSLPIETYSEYRVRIEDMKSLGYNWTLSSFGSFLRAKHPETQFVLSGSFLQQANGVYFSGIFESNLAESEKHKTLLEIVNNNISGIAVSYNIAGKIVKYYLSALNNTPAILRLGNTRELENPVKVIGLLQGVGNTQNFTERQNFTDINTSDLRNVFRKNIGASIKSRTHNTLVGGIKYIDKTTDSNKNYILENNPSFETLVVRNGNILIQDDFNTLGKTIGLISYIDAGYNKEEGYDEVGNIYVESEVQTISAFIYADGALISTQGGKPILGNITARNTLLTDQLSLLGSLFTRNTLAGGRFLNGGYILPGGEKTTQQSLATQYDLYYTRRGNTNCTKDIYGFCNIIEYLIIEYDARINSSPPKLFSN